MPSTSHASPTGSFTRNFTWSDRSPKRLMSGRLTIAGFGQVRDERPVCGTRHLEAHVRLVPIEAIRGEPLSLVQQECGVFSHPRKHWLVTAFIRIQDSRILDVE